MSIIASRLLLSYLVFCDFFFVRVLLSAAFDVFAFILFFFEEGAEDSYETLKELWVLLGVSCCRKAARLVLGEDGVFFRDGWAGGGGERKHDLDSAMWES